jgi:hypothetical protein
VTTDPQTEPDLTETQKAYNVAQSDMFQLAAYGHHRYHPLVEALTDEGKRQQRDYNDRLLAARDALEAALLRLVAEHAETFANSRFVSADWLRSLADDPGLLSLLAVRPDERDFDTDPPVSSAVAQSAPAETALRDRIAAVLRAHASLGGTPPHWQLPFFDGATPSLPRISGWHPLDDTVDALAAVSPDAARLHDQLLTQQAELAQLRGLLRTENGRANSAIDRETTTEEAGEAYRLAVSAALRLGTGATWEAIRDRAEDLTAEVEQLTETSRRLLEQRQEMAAERFVWQERGDRAEARVRQLEAAAPVDRATVEEHRLALSDALGLGTGAPWDAIRDRVTELALPPLGQDPVARRLGLVAEHRATVLNEAADALDGLTQETAAADMTMPEGRWRAGLDAGIRELRRLADEERDEREAQVHLDQLVEDVCRPVVIGGEIVRVHGAVEMSDESRAALAEVTAIVKRRMADEAQQQTETPCCSDPTCACVQVNAAGRCDCARWDDAPLPIRYRNWRGETADRKILPIRVWFGATDWHPEPQWFLRAVDVDRGVERDFALADMHDLPAVVPAGAGEEPADETRTLAAMFEGLHTLLATSSRDWGTYRVDAWLWAVLCGWDCEQAVHDETCTHGALEEMQQQHGWDDEAVAKARRYRAVVRAIEDRAAVPQPGKEH